MTDVPEPKPSNSALLFKIDSRLSVIESKLDTIIDHENRIRDLEQARYKSAWITSVLTSALSAGAVFLLIKGLGG